MPEQPVIQPSGATGTPAGGDQTPPKPADQVQVTVPAPVVTTPQPTTPAPVTPVPVSVQERIDRMYARLQKEREARIRAEQTIAATRSITQRSEVEEDEEEEVTQPQPAGVTTADVEAILGRKELEKKFQGSETRVLERHPTALKDDGSFNMDDPFVKEYIEVGRKNPYLALMENGPELAESFVNQKLGIDYKKGRVDEANRTTTVTNATTLSSTTSTPTVPSVPLTADEQTVAKKMGLTDAEYAKNKGRQPVRRT